MCACHIEDILAFCCLVRLTIKECRNVHHVPRGIAQWWSRVPVSLLMSPQLANIWTSCKPSVYIHMPMTQVVSAYFDLDHQTWRAPGTCLAYTLMLQPQSATAGLHDIIIEKQSSGACTASCSPLTPPTAYGQVEAMQTTFIHMVPAISFWNHLASLAPCTPAPEFYTICCFPHRICCRHGTKGHISRFLHKHHQYEWQRYDLYKRGQMPSQVKLIPLPSFTLFFSALNHSQVPSMALPHDNPLAASHLHPHRSKN